MDFDAVAENTIVFFFRSQRIFCFFFRHFYDYLFIFIYFFASKPSANPIGARLIRSDLGDTHRVTHRHTDTRASRLTTLYRVWLVFFSFISFFLFCFFWSFFLLLLRARCRPFQSHSDPVTVMTQSTVPPEKKPSTTQ